MNEEQIIKDLIEKVDDLIKLKGWKEFVSDIIIKVVIENGFKELKDYDGELYNETLDVAEAFIMANNGQLVDEIADLGAKLFKMIFFKKK